MGELDSYIEQAKKIAEKQKQLAEVSVDESSKRGHEKCSENHNLLASWLEDYKRLKEKDEKYRWRKGSPVGTVEEKCELEIIVSNGEHELVNFFPGEKWKFSCLQEKKVPYKNIYGIKAYRLHDPCLEEVKE